MLGISTNYSVLPDGSTLASITQGQPCCRATNPRCESPRPAVGLTGCDDCGHSGGCHVALS